jgi:hypothetical protein
MAVEARNRELGQVRIGVRMIGAELPAVVIRPKCPKQTGSAGVMQM